VNTNTNEFITGTSMYNFKNTDSKKSRVLDQKDNILIGEIKSTFNRTSKENDFESRFKSP